MPSPPESDSGVPRRGFLAAGAGAFLCTIGGERILLEQARRRRQGRRRRPPRVRAACPCGRRRAGSRADRAADLRHAAAPAGRDGARVLGAGNRGAVGHRADAPAARRVARPGGPGAQRVPRLRLPADDRRLRRASGRARDAGPTLYAEVGDTIVVHFRNGLPERSVQALPMHPHGVKYNPDYDGVFLGDFTRAGGSVRPGQEFTYTRERRRTPSPCRPTRAAGPRRSASSRRQLLQPPQADGEPQVADQLGLDRRVGRRPRREARSRPPRASRSSRPSPARPASPTPRRSPSPVSTKFICTLHEEDNMRMTITVRH